MTSLQRKIVITFLLFWILSDMLTSLPASSSHRTQPQLPRSSPPWPAIKQTVHLIRSKDCVHLTYCPAVCCQIKMQNNWVHLCSPGQSCWCSGTLPRTSPSPPSPRRSPHLQRRQVIQNRYNARWWSFVDKTTNFAISSVKKFSRTDPELNPEDVPPVERTHDQPEKSKKDVDPAHCLRWGPSIMNHKIKVKSTKLTPQKSKNYHYRKVKTFPIKR